MRKREILLVGSLYDLDKCNIEMGEDFCYDERDICVYRARSDFVNKNPATSRRTRRYLLCVETILRLEVLLVCNLG